MLPSHSQNLWVANRSTACDQVPLQRWLLGGPDFCQHTRCWGVHGSQACILLFPSPVPHLEAPTFFLPSPPQCSLSLKEITSLSCVGADTSAIFLFLPSRSATVFALLSIAWKGRLLCSRTLLVELGYEWLQSLSSCSSTQIVRGSWVNRSTPLPWHLCPRSSPHPGFPS